MPQAVTPKTELLCTHSNTEIGNIDSKTHPMERYNNQEFDGDNTALAQRTNTYTNDDNCC